MTNCELNMPEFNIREFNMSSIGGNRTVFFIGTRAAGKSTAVLDYLYHNKNFPTGTCISPMEKYHNIYTGKIPFVHEEYSPELIKTFVDRQYAIFKRMRRKEDLNIDPRAVLILEDCLYDSKIVLNDMNLKFIFMNGKHLYITCLLTMQYPLDLPPSLRDNVDYIFIFRESKLSTKRRLYQQYAKDVFPTFEMFNKVLDEYTKDHGCLVIDNRIYSNKLEDRVFWYRADVNKILHNKE